MSEPSIPRAASGADVEAGGAASGTPPLGVSCVSSAVPSREEWHQLHSQEAAHSSDAVTIRLLLEADLPAVMELHRELFPVQYTDSFYTIDTGAGAGTCSHPNAAASNDGCKYAHTCIGERSAAVGFGTLQRGGSRTCPAAYRGA